jgi:hypothetical protein
MIYLEQRFDLHPASPETLDHFIDFAQAQLVPAQEKAGARLAGAFRSHNQWYCQVVQLLQFPDLAAHGAFHEAMKADAASAARLEELAPKRRTQLFEAAGPVPAEALDAAIDASADKPEEAYTYAILEVLPGRMEDFLKLLRAAAPRLPIVAALTPVAGNPNQIVDLWKSAMGIDTYEPANPALKSFMDPLREVAPTERMENLFSLPYSPLR